jgi:hypothetical protein
LIFVRVGGWERGCGGGRGWEGKGERERVGWMRDWVYMEKKEYRVWEGG